MTDYIKYLHLLTSLINLALDYKLSLQQLLYCFECFPINCVNMILTLPVNFFVGGKQSAVPEENL
jgi:hypothetical protein